MRAGVGAGRCRSAHFVAALTALCRLLPPASRGGFAAAIRPPAPGALAESVRRGVRAPIATRRAAVRLLAAATTAASAMQAPQRVVDPSRRQVFVVGNEAADVDSLVSAYALAAAFDDSETQGIALAQIPREEFMLRGDAMSLFRSAGSALLSDGSPAGLLFWNEVDGAVVRNLEGRSLVLTDHNRIAQKVAEVFGGDVQFIFDHHSDARVHPDAGGEIVEGLGSACTLVVEEVVRRFGEMPPELGRLLAGAILLDTRNFSPKKKKATPRDQAAFEYVRPFIPVELGQDTWYKQLLKARKDVSQLSVEDLFVLDMKEAHVEGFDGRVAFAAMMTTLDDVLAKAGGPAELQRAMQGFAAERGFSAVVCIFAEDDSGFKALALAPASESQQALCDAIEGRLSGAPKGLPESLRENDLFATQGILELGFGMAPRADLAPLRAIRMRPEISRKTLLPCATTARAADDMAT
mmetsp:Transcript_30848/g.89744  ORF Transcript_30848/g.89744 Transcript_30848/m.89744 type:complete len:466 (-) Transcript_30848:11-1408(-)